MNMNPITELERLIAEMNPVLDSGEWVFLNIGEAGFGDLEKWQPAAMVNEAEGMSLIVPLAIAAKAGLATADTMRRITLTVYSDLQAVGLTAAVSSALAEAGISANMVAGFHHDHIFVPDGQAVQAVAILKSLANAD